MVQLGFETRLSGSRVCAPNYCAACFEKCEKSRKRLQAREVVGEKENSKIRIVGVKSGFRSWGCSVHLVTISGVSDTEGH